MPRALSKRKAPPKASGTVPTLPTRTAIPEPSGRAPTLPRRLAQTRKIAQPAARPRGGSSVQLRIEQQKRTRAAPQKETQSKSRRLVAEGQEKSICQRRV